MADPRFPGAGLLPVAQIRAESLARHLTMANAFWMAGDQSRYDRHMKHATQAMADIAADRAAILKEQGS